jgi:hypothetical protein
MATKHMYRTPSIEELYALEHEARRLRAQAVAEFFRGAVKTVRGAFAREATAPAPRTMRHA